jgi:hypothetical protein
VLELGNMQEEEQLDKGVVRELVRKVDLRLMPALGLLYAFSLIDRVNLSVVCLHIHNHIVFRLGANNFHRLGSQEWILIWACPLAIDILLLP